MVNAGRMLLVMGAIVALIGGSVVIANGYLNGDRAQPRPAGVAYSSTGIQCLDDLSRSDAGQFKTVRETDDTDVTFGMIVPHPRETQVDVSLQQSTRGEYTLYINTTTEKHPDWTHNRTPTPRLVEEGCPTATLIEGAGRMANPVHKLTLVSDGTVVNIFNISDSRQYWNVDPILNTSS